MKKFTLGIHSKIIAKSPVKKFNSADGESPAEVDYWHPAVNSDRPEPETRIPKDLQKKSKVQLSSPSRFISTNQTSNDPLIENRYFLPKASLRS